MGASLKYFYLAGFLETEYTPGSRSPDYDKPSRSPISLCTLASTASADLVDVLPGS